MSVQPFWDDESELISEEDECKYDKTRILFTWVYHRFLQAMQPHSASVDSGTLAERMPKVSDVSWHPYKREACNPGNWLSGWEYFKLFSELP